ncbi:indole-3-glycerol phosphate synthase TrpC [Candidatus Omnitrophota bacterium]
MTKINFLQQIIEEKKAFIEKQKNVQAKDELSGLSIGKSRFKNILEKPGTHLIAEIKRASPSKGDLRPDLNIVDIASIYEKGGIELISVLAEEKFFKGSLADLVEVKKNTSLSILCKDFIIDETQIHQAKAHGADAVLLIAKILTNIQLKEMLDITKKLKMDAVVEVHDAVELDRVLELGSDVDIIGINHRNLDDFKIDLNVSAKLLPKIPSTKLVIAESGINSAEEIRQFKELCVNAVLVGESLMRENDIAKKISEFKQALK